MHCCEKNRQHSNALSKRSARLDELGVARKFLEEIQFNQGYPAEPLGEIKLNK
jgi:hypothetical protein